MENNVNDNKFHIKMFGRFEMTYQGKNISFGRNTSSRSVRLFQIILAYRGRGISRHDLAVCLYQNEEVANAANSIRVAQHRFKKQLESSGVPRTMMDYYVTDTEGYCWNEEFPAETDVELFMNYLEEAAELTSVPDKIQCLYEAFRLYQGDFLEEAGAEEWAVVFSVWYKRMYVDLTQALIDLLRETRDYERMLEVSRRASQLYPYDEWQVYVLESYQKMGLTREAGQVYNETVRMYREELDLDVPEHLTEVYKQSMTQDAQSGLIDDICNKLEASLNSRGGGAAYLTFANFSDTFRLMLRLTERNGQNMCLMLCKLKTECAGEYNKKDSQHPMQILKDTICDTLRSGDCYTDFDQGYLILLMGAEEDKCDLVFNRIERSFKNRRRNKILWESELTYDIVPIESFHRII